jgi:carbon storage regulator
MLVLSRKQSESIQIGQGDEKIIVTVTQIKPGQVRIGIEAPAHVPVYRTEVITPDTDTLSA